MPRPLCRKYTCPAAQRMACQAGRGDLVAAKFDFSRCFAYHKEIWDAPPGGPPRPAGVTRRVGKPTFEKDQYRMSLHGTVPAENNSATKDGTERTN